MGQEYGQVHEWSENKALDWEDLEKTGTQTDAELYESPDSAL